MRAFLIIALEILLPLFPGALFALSENEADTRFHFLVRSILTGQVIIFALFQPVMVFSILKNYSLTKGITIYLPILGAVVLASLLAVVIKYRGRFISVMKTSGGRPDIFELGALVVFGIMIVMSFFVTYYDGDDSYYVTMATQSESSDAMYAAEPYTGGLISNPYRYLFAPYPIWISMLSRITGVRAVAVAHSYFPWFMISLSFGILYLFSRSVFGQDAKKRGIFLFLSSILVLFGDYSIYSAENFLLARSRQGKAALASFALPWLLFLLLETLKEMEESRKVSAKKYFLIMLSGMTAALCSTMGGMLVCALTGVFAVVILAMYRKIKVPVLMMISAAPSLVFIVLYLYMRSIVP